MASWLHPQPIPPWLVLELKQKNDTEIIHGQRKKSVSDFSVIPQE